MKISVIIPVYNEQDSINGLIAYLRSLGDFEIVVSDCNSNTNKVIVDKYVIKISSTKGRGNQLNAGASNATGDAYLFLHADSIPPEGFQAEIEKGLSNHSAGAFALAVDSPKKIFRIIEKSVRVRNSITREPYGDQGIFCLREAFEKVNGFRDIPIMEDVRLMKDFKKNGISIYLSEMQMKTSPRRWEKEGIVYTTLRNWFIILLYNAGFSPKWLKRLYK